MCEAIATPWLGNVSLESPSAGLNLFPSSAIGQVSSRTRRTTIVLVAMLSYVHEQTGCYGLISQKLRHGFGFLTERATLGPLMQCSRCALIEYNAIRWRSQRLWRSRWRRMKRL